jgi:HlyD family secretion protein
VVKDLTTHTLGSVVSAGTVLLSLVPLEEPLVAEVQLPNEDVGFVHTGQHVKLKLAAYPFQQYGLLEGRVQQVSPDADAVGDQEPTTHPTERTVDRGALPAMSYRVLITLQQQTLNSQGQVLRLTPGMRVIAEIHQGSRTVLQYVLSPVRKTLMESGQER